MAKKMALVTTEKEKFQHKLVLLIEHYVLVGEPGECHLSYILTKNGKGRDIVERIKDETINTDLEDTLAVIGIDGTAATT